MFRTIRKKINEIDKNAAEELLLLSRRGVLAVNGDDGYPYAIPINYIYDRRLTLCVLVIRYVSLFMEMK